MVMIKKLYLIITLFLQSSLTNIVFSSTDVAKLFNEVNTHFLEFFKQKAPKDVVIKLYANWEINYPAASTERSLMGKRVTFEASSLSFISS